MSVSMSHTVGHDRGHTYLVWLAPQFQSRKRNGCRAPWPAPPPECPPQGQRRLSHVTMIHEDSAGSRMGQGTGPWVPDGVGLGGKADTPQNQLVTVGPRVRRDIVREPGWNPPLISSIRQWLHSQAGPRTGRCAAGSQCPFARWGSNRHPVPRPESADPWRTPGSLPLAPHNGFRALHKGLLVILFGRPRGASTM